MFNSELFADIDVNIGFSSNPLILAVNDQYRELLSFEALLWQKAKKSGIRFEDHYQPYFPLATLSETKKKHRILYWLYIWHLKVIISEWTFL